MWTPVICESADLNQWTLYIKHYSEIVASKPDEDGAIPWAWIVDHNSELVPVQKLGWKKKKKKLWEYYYHTTWKQTIYKLYCM